jgi:hypothetical protein
VVWTCNAALNHFPFVSKGLLKVFPAVKFPFDSCAKIPGTSADTADIPANLKKLRLFIFNLIL